jgi:hypothetical protein
MAAFNAVNANIVTLGASRRVACSRRSACVVRAAVDEAATGKPVVFYTNKAGVRVSASDEEVRAKPVPPRVLPFLERTRRRALQEGSVPTEWCLRGSTTQPRGPKCGKRVPAARGDPPLPWPRVRANLSGGVCGLVESDSC